MSAGSQRLFFALWPDENTLDALRSAAPVWLSTWSGRALLPRDLHITLCFLGAVAHAEIPGLCERAAALRAAPFELRLDRLQYWRGSRSLVLTGEQVPAAGRLLAAQLLQLARDAGLAPADNTWRPHLTLMRSVKAPPGDAGAPAPQVLAPMTLRATRFYLAQSHELGAATLAASEPPRYQQIAHWPLAG